MQHVMLVEMLLFFFNYEVCLKGSEERLNKSRTHTENNFIGYLCKLLIATCSYIVITDQSPKPLWLLRLLQTKICIGEILGCVRSLKMLKYKQILLE